MSLETSLRSSECTKFANDVKCDESTLHAGKIRAIYEMWRPLFFWMVVEDVKEIMVAWNTQCARNSRLKVYMSMPLDVIISCSNLTASFAKVGLLMSDSTSSTGHRTRSFRTSNSAWSALAL